VQISSWAPEVAALESVAVVREAQRRRLAPRNTAMIVSADIGDPHNIHAGDKQDVGARLTLAARALAYDETVEYSGPAFRQVTRSGSSLRVWFDHAAGLRGKGGQLPDFEIAGNDTAERSRVAGLTIFVG
jgi:sialate O-acetylesterase